MFDVSIDNLLKIILAAQWLVLSFASLLYLILGYSLHREKRIQQDRIQKLSQYILGKLNSNNAKEASEIPRQYHDPVCLLSVIELFDSRGVKRGWSTVREIILKNLLLPQARKLAKSKKYKDQVCAIRSFSLCPLEQDEIDVIRFLKNRMSLVRFEAVSCAVRIGSKNCINALIDVMSNEERFASYAYKDAFLGKDKKLFDIVMERLKNEVDESARIACLTILSLKRNEDLYHHILHDIHSPNKELRIQVAKSLASCVADASIHVLMSMLDDKDWEVRACTANSLGELKASIAVPKLAMTLRDKRWWVRVNSASALKKIGGEGIRILELQDPVVDRFAFETARYVLSIEGD